jgi:type IV secretory pathway VirD2 relaxase
MALIESGLRNALHPPVKRRANRTEHLRATAGRVTRGATEVMVKISSFGKGVNAVYKKLDYVSREGTLQLENERGEVFNGREETKLLFNDWKTEFGDSKRYKNQRDTMNLILSMPATVDSESVLRATRHFTRSTFGKNHEYVFVLHTDELHPHCHVIVKCLGFDGKRLNPRKADLQSWREGFAEKLRDQGVEAEATPRRSRGVTLKPERAVFRHIETSKIRKSLIQETDREILATTQGALTPPDPWEEKIKKQQTKIRGAWLDAATLLERNEARMTFNGKETHNARPDYKRVPADRARTAHRVAGLYQSNLAKSGRGAPSRSVARLRDLSRLDVVQHKKQTTMLLHPDASDSLGRRTATYNELRRPGIGASSPGGIRSPLTHDDSSALAARIRKFVSAMPQLDTAKRRLMRERLQFFKKSPAPVVEQSRGVSPDATRSPSQNQESNER